MLGDLVAGVRGRRAAAASCERHAAEANAALDEFATFLEQRDAAARLVSATRSAASATPSQSRYFLGATVDLDETYAWGWEELKRISDDMAATADRILPGAPYAEAVAHLEADPARRIARPRGVPRLDAGAGRPRPSPSSPTSTSTSPSRSAGSSA